MRVLQTPPRLYPAIGGVETVVLSLSRALADLGHEVEVLCADEPARGPSTVAGIPTRRLWYPIKVANTNITPALPAHLALRRFDVVHTHLPTPWSADWSALLGRARRKGVVLSYYNDILGSGSAGQVASLYNRLCLPVTLRLVHRVVINSTHLLDKPGSPLRRARRKLRQLPNGVDTELLRPQPELRQPGRIGFLAVLDQFHRYKGADVLLEATRQLACRGHTIDLRIGGDGPLRAEYASTAASLGISDHVRFEGFVPEGSLPDFLNSCQVFVLPSTDAMREGYGLVALEAMACGLPVVVTEATGVAALVRDCDAGFVVPPGDPAALALAIERLISSPDIAHHHGMQGRKAMEERHSWKAIAHEFEQLYTQAINAARTPRKRLHS
ncbi:MAG: glycosyltransferase family 4 protein [Chloroflexia bacterium]